ncbi:hypothetical protein OH76DRAFT_1555394 [Lentinus brumalis]|uniref:SAP domain-containing protein n=1 Tax=Lentinus brumalis TaxID=2498619 RepID=A0A371DEE2_9APHY|nr:hypothetical protein OH76DRAFT_1555394 [Polyporus brumalis]
MATTNAKKRKPVSPTISLTLPCLGQAVTDDGHYETEAYKITTKVTVRHMKDRLASYGQETGGNREEVIARLVRFAENVPEWKVLFHPKQKRKRGDATGTRSEKHSAKRIQNMFEPDTESQSTAYPSKSTNVDRPGAIAMTKFQIAQLDEWTHDVLASYSLTSTSVMKPEVNTRQEAQDTDGLEVGLQLMSDNGMPVVAQGQGPTHSLRSDAIMRQSLRRVENMTRKLEQKIDTLVAAPPAQIAVARPPVRGPPRPPCPAPVQSISAHLSPQHPAVSELPTESSISASAPHAAGPVVPIIDAEMAAPEKQISVLLGDERLTCYASQIPDPPRRHYSQDIPELFHEWEHGGLLKIQGRAIPLKYWPDVYQKRSPRRKGKREKDGDVWELMKGEYGKWRWLVEEKDRLGSEDAFWAKYSDPASGTRLQYSQIQARLKSQRTRTFREDAQAAKEYFGGDLTRADTQGAFMYKKGSTMVLLTQNKQIAEQWLELLRTHPMIAATWEAMRAAKAVAASRPPPSSGHQ